MKLFPFLALVMIATLCGYEFSHGDSGEGIFNLLMFVVLLVMIGRDKDN